jgi:hypothetical protein
MIQQTTQQLVPLEVSFLGAWLAARLQTRVRRKGKWSREVITSGKRGGEPKSKEKSQDQI